MSALGCSIYLICILIAFILGLNVRNKHNQKSDVKEILKTPPDDNRITDIKEMFKFIRKNKTLPLNLSREIIKALIEIANTPDWENKIDDETISNLHEIYCRWVNVKDEYAEAAKVSIGGGFNYTKYWEGTWEEFKQAKINGEIDEQTRAVILTETGATLAMDEDGQIEEYFE